jgi:hypothetical protein
MLTRTPLQELAYKILTRDGEWGMTGCLQSAKTEVALRGYDDLDDLSQKHIRVLALLCAGLPWNSSTTEIYFPLESTVLAQYLEDICELKYAEESDDAYQVTIVGKNVIQKIGIEMLGMDRFRMKGELEASERLLQKFL